MENTKKRYLRPTLIRKCHFCDHINESSHELEECQKCSEAFLPLRYMEKIHSEKLTSISLYEKSTLIDEKDFIKGLYVLW